MTIQEPMKLKIRTRARLLATGGAALLAALLPSCSPDPTSSDAGDSAAPAAGGGEALKIAYSDWPGWVAWEIGIQKKWFAEAGVDVEFLWFDYVPSMDAYVAGQVDAVCMTNGDALVTGATGKPSVGIILNDYSNALAASVGAVED